MELVAISDTHLRCPELETGDVLIHSGDATFRGDIREVSQFSYWWNNIEGFKHKIFVPGNHDWLFQRNEPFARELLKDTHVLIDNEVTIDGTRFYGSPWQPEFCNWSFNLPRGEKLKEKWDMIPDGIDILITHGPPHGFLDFVPGGGNVGCKDLFDAVCRVKPKYHIFGHVHYSYGEKYWQHTGTTFINASVCTEAYQCLNKPIVFEI